MQRIQYVEKIFARWAFAFGENGREKRHELGILFELGPERLDTELIVVGHRDISDCIFFHQVSFPSEDIFKKVLVDGFLRGQVILDYKEISDERY